MVEERRTAFHCAVTVHSCVYTRHFLFIGRLYIGFVGCHMKKKKKKLRSGTGLASALVGDKLNRNIHICWAVSIYIYNLIRVSYFCCSVCSFTDCASALLKGCKLYCSVFVNCAILFSFFCSFISFLRMCATHFERRKNKAGKAKNSHFFFLNLVQPFVIKSLSAACSLCSSVLLCFNYIGENMFACS